MPKPDLKFASGSLTCTFQIHVAATLSTYWLLDAGRHKRETYCDRRHGQVWGILQQRGKVSTNLESQWYGDRRVDMCISSPSWRYRGIIGAL
jgi:hypothetical protein